MTDQPSNSGKKQRENNDRYENIKDKGFDHNPQNINRDGRPRKYITTLKTEGYKQSEINDVIEKIIDMGPDELKEVTENKDKKHDVLEITLAKAILNGVEKGTLGAIETVLSRRFGSPKATLDAVIRSEQPLFGEDDGKK